VAKRVRVDAHVKTCLVMLKLVAELHQTGPVTVQHNVELVGKSGAPRQIDVLVRQRSGLYEHLILVECKYWDAHVSRLHVDALAAAVQDLNASRGVIFSVKGFQSGAITAARAFGIDLYKVRDLTDREWGLPGKVVDLILQVVWPSIGNIAFPGVSAVSASSERVDLAIHLAQDDRRSRTLISLNGRPAKCEGEPVETLEDLIEKAAMNAFKKFNAASFTINGGEECTRYMILPAEIAPIEPLTAILPNAKLSIPRVKFDVGVKIAQSRIHIDRAKKYVFALALENSITGGVHAASRDIDASETDVKVLGPPRANPEPAINGSYEQPHENGGAVTRI
jgi:hypothetical protein